MQRLCLRFVFVFLFLSTGAGSALASHIYGADFFYEYISGNSYRISLWVYGDCGAVPPNGVYPTLATSSPEVQILRNGNEITRINLVLSGPDSILEVTPVCTAQKNNTSCVDPSKPIPGVTRYTYSAIYNLPPPYKSNNWLFRFDGKMNASTTAGRSNSISNLTIFGTTNGSVMTLDALLNNSVRDSNSSPVFKTIPTPFYCVNIAQQYNQAAVDADKDSLVFSLVPGLEPGGTPVSYNPGYSATSPLSTTPGGFSFNRATGQMNFTPNTTQRSLVVNQVTEYYNGVVIGTASREMTFVVLANCNTNPATNHIDTSKSSSATMGGVISGLTDFNVCQGTDSARFNIVARNPANNTIQPSVIGLPAGATATILNNNTVAPIITVSWKNITAAAGNYTFYVTYKDNGCPLTSSQTQAYTIHVYRPNELATYIAAPTQCAHQALVDYSFSYGLAPRTITVSRNGNVIRTFRDSTGHKRDSLGSGTYQVSIMSDMLPCPSYYDLTIVDSGIYPHPPQTATAYYCKFDQPAALIAKGDSNSIVRWYNAGGTQLGAPPVPRTDTTGIFTWYVDQVVKVCPSKKDSVKVYVTLRPTAAFSAPDRICLDDTATFDFTGKIGVGPIIDYRWDFDHAGYTVGDSAGPWRVHWYDTGTKIIRLVVDENKCSSYPFADTVYVKPVPYAGFFVSDVCQFDTMRASYSTTPYPGQGYAWTFSGASIPAASGPGPYYLVWQDTGLKRLSLTVALDGCFDTRSRELHVRPLPVARILNLSGPVCMGDRITLLGTGGTNYRWLTSDSMLHPQETSGFSFQILHPETFILAVQNEWACKDSAAITYSTVEPCCHFAYPDAFTPNGDQRNDRFHVVTYGNALEFELSIYNRWGQRVYYGLDPKQGWDGTFGGKLCDAGAYFYYVNAKCFTGYQETHKGEVMLIR